MSLGVRVVQPIDVAEQYQQIRPAQLRHDGREGVVIAQDLMASGLDLGGGDGVIFVHHRDDPHLQQGGEGVGQVLRPLRVLHIISCQQDLGHGAVVLGEEFVVNVHHPALAHRSGCLLHPQLLRPLGQPQLGGAHSDGTGGHQDHLMPHALEIRQGPHQMFHAPKVQRAGVMGEGGGAHLHHNALFVLFQSYVPPWVVIGIISLIPSSSKASW